MGTKMAPAYATRTLAYLENLNEIIDKKYNNIKTEFTCYFDDCFII